MDIACGQLRRLLRRCSRVVLRNGGNIRGRVHRGLWIAAMACCLDGDALLAG